jgi:hypothetical protein
VDLEPFGEAVDRSRGRLGQFDWRAVPSFPRLRKEIP